MEDLLHLSGGDSGRSISLEKKVRQMINTRRRAVRVPSSYYAREGSTYERGVKDRDGCSKEFRVDIPKSIETESFPSSVGMV